MKLRGLWLLPKDAVSGFIADDALSRGAAIAFYTVTSIAPLLLVVIAIAGLFFGRETAQAAVTAQFSGLMGKDTAAMLEKAVANASGEVAGSAAAIIGLVMLTATVSGTFGEMQSALNAIWKAKPKGTTVSRLIRARAASLGLVATLGFLLVISLAASAALTALGDYANARLPLGAIILAVLNFAVSFVLLSVLFAAVYKVLPDCELQWRDVVLGAAATTLLFLGGRSLIGWYLGSSAVASTYGAAGSLIVLLLWVYYSVQIFLLGAELTKSFAHHHGSKQNEPKRGEA